MTDCQACKAMRECLERILLAAPFILDATEMGRECLADEGFTEGAAYVQKARLDFQAVCQQVREQVGV